MANSRLGRLPQCHCLLADISDAPPMAHDLVDIGLRHGVVTDPVQMDDPKGQHTIRLTAISCVFFVQKDGSRQATYSQFCFNLIERGR